MLINNQKFSKNKTGIYLTNYPKKHSVSRDIIRFQNKG